MAKKSRKKNRSNHSKSRRQTRADPLRSFLGLKVPDYTPYTMTTPSYAPAPRTERKGRFLPPNNPTTSKTPVDLYKATKTTVLKTPLDICSKRSQRKQIIHAFNHAGKTGQKPQQRTPASNFHCKG